MRTIGGLQGVHLAEKRFPLRLASLLIGFALQITPAHTLLLHLWTLQKIDCGAKYAHCIALP